MTGQEYGALTKELQGEHKWTSVERLTNAAMGLSGESGEITDHIKKHLFHGHDLDRDHLIEELGDVLWYINYMATTLGFSLDDVMERNLQKLRKRYPNGFSSERSKNRDKEVREDDPDFYIQEVSPEGVRYYPQWLPRLDVKTPIRDVLMKKELEEKTRDTEVRESEWSDGTVVSTRKTPPLKIQVNGVWVEASEAFRQVVFEGRSYTPQFLGL